jgi:hypothetical protein
MTKETISTLKTNLGEVRKCCESGTNAFYGIAQLEKTLTTLVSEIELTLSPSAPTAPPQQ